LLPMTTPTTGLSIFNPIQLFREQTILAILLKLGKFVVFSGFYRACILIEWYSNSSYNS